MIATTAVQAAVIAAFTSAAESMPTMDRGSSTAEHGAREKKWRRQGSGEIERAADQPGNLPAALSLGTGIPNAA
jgi:hypothetical protein